MATATSSSSVTTSADPVQINATLIFQNTSIRLMAITGLLFEGIVNVFECCDPYVLIFVISSKNGGQSARMNVDKNDLMAEMKHWLDGKKIRRPSVMVTRLVEDSMSSFLKLAKTPPQRNLIQWILSRTEVKLGSRPDARFGGYSIEELDVNDPESRTPIITNDEYTRNLSVARDVLEESDMKAALKATSGGSGYKGSYRPSSAPARRSTSNSTYEISKALLGNQSQAIKDLKTATVVGRGDAKDVKVLMTSDQYLLGASIEKARKDIEETIEKRRRIVEIVKTRKQQALDKYRAIRDAVNESKSGNQWNSKAINELKELNRMKEEIDVDIQRIRTRAQKEHTTLVGTLAPPSFPLYRGKSVPGIVIGNGPIPASATSSLKDPRVETTLKTFYWDEFGRRHKKNPTLKYAETEGHTMIEKCFAAIANQSESGATYKLDLKACFEKFDTSGDGYLTEKELAEALISLGVPIDLEGIREIFSHFDPNNSGSIHYGEFLWSFFNRRKFIKSFQEEANGMTYQKKLQLFHDFDTNGNGYLNKKEFTQFAKNAKLNLSALEIDLIFQKFDVDKSGDISVDEFELFLLDEIKRLGPDFHKERVINPKAHLSFDKSTYGGSKKNTKDDRTSPVHAKSTPIPSNSMSSSSSSSNTSSSQRPSSAKPRLSQTDPIRPTSASSKPAAKTTSKSLAGNDTKLIDTIKGISGSNPLVTKSMDIPSSKRLYSSSSSGGGVEKTIFEESKDVHSGREHVSSAVATAALTVSKDSIASAHQASLVVDILQTQAHIESQLGSKYYN